VTGTGDYDRDGDADVMARSKTTGDIGIYTIESLQIQSHTAVGNTALDWQIL
jgi:hypothetical protein